MNEETIRLIADAVFGKDKFRTWASNNYMEIRLSEEFVDVQLVIAFANQVGVPMRLKANPVVAYRGADAEGELVIVIDRVSP